ncbi:50S ribosomal protein L31 [Gammaproteobacteria bacterium]|nr:50S ribosomal protein L31 [Gammaproteobacteria bacterium]
MKTDIHPNYQEISTTCSCGNVLPVMSTLKDSLSLDVCSKCHPFYTGKQKMLDSGGRVKKFQDRFGASGASKPAAKKEAPKVEEAVAEETEQLEITLQELFPQISIFRMDKDSTKKANSMELLLKAIHESKSSILIGTQMLIKGHDFPNLELVVAIDVDQGVTSLHPAAIEEMGQQLIQVAGRAGRSDGNALVLVQSRYAQDKNLLQLKKGNYLNFAKSILAERKALNQPPYSFEAIIKAASPKTQTNIDFLDQLKKTIDTKRCIAVGPIPAMQAKVRGSYQHHLVLQAPTRTDLNSLLQDLINQLSKNKSSNKVRWSVDVDPVEF